MHGFVENFLVHLETDFGDKTTLFRSKNIPRATYIEISHSDVKTASNIGKFLNGPKSLAGLITQHRKRRSQQITECFTVRPAHAATQLVKIAQPIVVRIIDEDGVGIWNIKT